MRRLQQYVLLPAKRSGWGITVAADVRLLGCDGRGTGRGDYNGGWGPNDVEDPLCASTALYEGWQGVSAILRKYQSSSTATRVSAASHSSHQSGSLHSTLEWVGSHQHHRPVVPWSPCQSCAMLLVRVDLTLKMAVPLPPPSLGHKMQHILMPWMSPSFKGSDPRTPCENLTAAQSSGLMVDQLIYVPGSWFHEFKRRIRDAAKNEVQVMSGYLEPRLPPNALLPMLPNCHSDSNTHSAWNPLFETIGRRNAPLSLYKRICCRRELGRFPSIRYANKADGEPLAAAFRTCKGGVDELGVHMSKTINFDEYRSALPCGIAGCREDNNYRSTQPYGV